MFDIGWTELLVIAVVAIIIVGPKDLPRMLRSLGRYASKLKQTAGEFRAQFDEALRESELDELRTSMRDMTASKPLEEIKAGVNEGLDPLKSTAEGIRKKAETPGSRSGAGRMKTDPAPAKAGAAKAAEPAAAETEPAPAAESEPASGSKSASGSAAKAGS